MNNEIVEFVGTSDIAATKEYAPIIKDITNYAPVIAKDIKNYCKTQSQFMDNILTVTHHTAERNIHQMLAEIEKAQSALGETHFKLKEKGLTIKKLQRQLEKEEDEIEAEILENEIARITYEIQQTQKYQGGALRKIANYMENIKKAKEALGVENLSEVDFERAEEQHHIMKAFDQAITAARARGGVVDEGNHIYFNQLGINGAAAQTYISQYFTEEGKILNSGKVPDGNCTYRFLLQMAEVFRGCSETALVRKHMATNDKYMLSPVEQNN